jgi:hypothetical protein
MAAMMDCLDAWDKNVRQQNLYPGLKIIHAGRRDITGNRGAAITRSGGYLGDL